VILGKEYEKILDIVPGAEERRALMPLAKRP